MRLAWACATALAMLVGWASALAQPQATGAPSLAAGPPLGGMSPPVLHAWIVVPTAKGEGVVLHLPPRRSPDVDGRARGVPDGSARVAGRLSEMPAMIAAWGDRLYLLEDRPEKFPSTPRRMSSLRAVRTGVGDLWGTEPRDGLDAHANLPGVGRLVALTACAMGPAALIDAGRPGSVVPRAFILVDGRWTEVSTPRIDESPERFFWQGTGQGLELIAVRANGTCDAWTLAVDKGLATLLRQSTEDRPASGPEPRPPVRVDVEWAPGDPGVWPGLPPSRVAALGQVAGQRVALTREGAGEYTLRQRAGGEWRVLASLTGPSDEVAMAPLDGMGRVAVLWSAGSPGASELERWEIAEASVFTGALAYRGALRLAAPISVTDVRWLLLSLLGVMSLVVAFVLRAEGRADVVAIPEGMAMAELGRRLVALLVDYAAAVLVAAMALGVSVREALSVQGLLGGQGLWLLGAGLAVAALVGAFMEWGTGRTLGKMLAGCEVLDAKAGAPGAINANEGRPTFARALARNLLKYALPPTMLTALLDMNARHVGDRLSGTVVVVHASPEDSSEDE